jgi:hypothetical protein
MIGALAPARCWSREVANDRHRQCRSQKSMMACATLTLESLPFDRIKFLHHSSFSSPFQARKLASGWSSLNVAATMRSACPKSNPVSMLTKSVAMSVLFFTGKLSGIVEWIWQFSTNHTHDQKAAREEAFMNDRTETSPTSKGQ